MHPEFEAEHDIIHEQINYEDVINLDQKKIEEMDQTAVSADLSNEQELLGKRRLNNGENIVNRQLD